MSKIKRFLSDTSGATSVEYGLIASLVALIIITAVTNVGKNASSKYQTVAANLK